MNLEIPRKTEAWKFSPLGTVNSFNIKTKPELKKVDFHKIKVAVGPSEQQVHTVHLQDLIDSGTAEVSFKKSESYFFNDSNTKRANLDRNLESLTKSEKTATLKILKSPQSTLWIDPNSLSSNIEIEICENSNANILFFETEKDQAADESSFSKISFSIDQNAKLELGVSLSTANNSFSQINISVGEGAHFNSYSLMSGAAVYKRLETNVFLTGKESRATLNGLNCTRAKSIFDYHSNVFHLNKDQVTHQNYKAVCKDQSKSIFSGRVHLTENSSGAAVHQLNNNLLLDKKSSVDTQPELNIYHDNVKASHGATTSSLDENHIFYFSSRGFKPEHTKKILLEAFCKSTCSNLESPGIKEFFKKAISKELYGV